MKTAVIYARYSCDAQTEQSIEGQLHVCKEYAERNDLLVVDEYIDRATTGTNDNRAAFQQMLADSKRRQWSVVIVYKLDRFARNMYESVINRKKLSDNGVGLVSAMENIPDTPEGKLFQAVIEGFNEYYSAECFYGHNNLSLKVLYDPLNREASKVAKIQAISENFIEFLYLPTQSPFTS